MDRTYETPESGLTNTSEDLSDSLLPVELLEKTDRFSDITRSNLLAIVRDNKNTEAGISLGFSEIDSEEKFRSSVALSRYSDYRDFVECMRMGDADLITSYSLYAYTKASGTDDDEKILPLTEIALSHYKSYIDEPCEKICEIYGGKRLMISMLHAEATTSRAKIPDMLFSAAYYSYRYKHGLMDITQYEGREPLNFFHRNCDFLYAKVWMAFACSDINTIESVFLYDLLFFFRYTEKHYIQIIENMKSREIPLSVNLPSYSKDALLALPIDSERLDTVKRECEKGFENIVKRLWPSVRLVSGMGSETYGKEDSELKYYISDIPIWYFCYATGECPMGIAMQPGSKDYLLMPDSAYYEFLPESHTVEPEKWVKRSSEVTVGENYEIVLTTYNGLYRYMLGDIVKVTGFCGQAPIIRFMYRRHQLLNIAGEKINEKALTAAVKYALDFYRHEASEYFFTEDHSETPAHYNAFFCSEKKLDKIDISYFTRVLDTALKQEVFDYADLRNLNMIGPIKVHWLSPEEYNNLKVS